MKYILYYDNYNYHKNISPYVIYYKYFTYILLYYKWKTYYNIISPAVTYNKKMFLVIYLNIL